MRRKTEGEGDGLVSKGDGSIGESTKAGNKGINQQEPPDTFLC